VSEDLQKLREWFNDGPGKFWNQVPCIECELGRSDHPDGRCDEHAEAPPAPAPPAADE
jgi:hypothetical protein